MAALAVVGLVALTAIGVRFGDHPAFVRVVVDFNGAVPFNQVEFDHIWTKTAALRIEHPGIATSISGGSGEGVSVALQPATQALNIAMSFAPHRFKYISYAVVTGNRLAIDLWKSAPPGANAEIRAASDGCLALRSWHVAPGTITVKGAEHDLFEHSLVVLVRGKNGRVLGKTPHGVTAAAGKWHTSVNYTATRRQPGTLEAVAFSAKDGALVCIAQMRVTLPAS